MKKTLTIPLAVMFMLTLLSTSLFSQTSESLSVDPGEYFARYGYVIPEVPEFYPTLTPLTADEMHILDTLTREERKFIEEAIDPPFVGIIRNLKYPITFNLAEIEVPEKGEISTFGGRLSMVNTNLLVYTTYIQSTRADEIRIFFAEGNIPQGVKVNIFSKDNFSFNLRNFRGSIDEYGYYTRTAFADYIFLQVVIPLEEIEENLQFTISKIIHVDNRYIPEESSKSCYLDANCADANSYTHIDGFRRATARLYFPSGGGYGLCSGGQLNDTRDKDWQPFLLTANHCFSTQTSAAGLEARFYYWSTSCNSGVVNPDHIIVDGANLIATNSQSDFTMVLLKERGGNYYLGWDLGSVANNTVMHSVHHPSGTLMKYHRMQNKTSPGFVCDGFSTTNFHYTKATIGQESPGSSGGLVMDPDGRVRGQLYGTCHLDTWDNCSYDTYYNMWGRFNVSFNNNNLQYWLNSGGASVAMSAPAASHDYGSVNVGSYEDYVITVTNTGTRPNYMNLEAGNVSVTGTNSSQFSVIGASFLYLAPGESGSFTARFSPTSTGTKTASFNIPNNSDNQASPYVITLTGYGNPCSDIISMGAGGSANTKTFSKSGEGSWISAACGYNCFGTEQVYSFVAPYTGFYSIEVTSSNSVYIDYFWKTSACSSSGWNCIDDIIYTGTYGSMSWTAGTTYYILLDPEGTSLATQSFYVFLNPCLNITTIAGTGPGNSKTYTGGGYGAWFTSTLSSCGYLCEGIEKIYSFVPSQTGYYGIQVTSASSWVDYMWKSGACSSSDWICLDDIYNPTLLGPMYMEAGTTYLLLLDDEDNTAGSHTFYITLGDAPGTWTGTVNTNWNVPGNWAWNILPDETIDVTIPSAPSNEPFIQSADASCKSININSAATLTVGGYSLTVENDLNITGTLNLNNSSGVITVFGDVYWQSGSTAGFTVQAPFHVYGNWEFKAGSNANLAQGTVLFWGTNDKYIFNYSLTSSFNNIGSYKSGGAEVGIAYQSTQPLNINGGIYVHPGANFGVYSTKNVILRGDLNSNNVFLCNYGTFVLDGASQSLRMNIGNYFNNLTFSQSGTVTIDNSQTSILDVNGNVSIESGVFNLQDRTMYVGGNWTNTSGTGSFNEGTSRVIFDGPGHQYVNSSETFNILEAKMGNALRINNASYTVTCNQYDWTSGGIDVLLGTFTALDLYDNGIYGGFWLNPGGTINITNDAWIDLNGNLNIYGGNFNVYGGTVDSDWPFSSNASISMSDGVLDFKNRGIRIYNNASYTLTENITGGTIRTVGSFENQRSDFTPSGGIIEMYGTTDAYLATSVGCSVYNILINKGADESGMASTQLYDREGKPVEESKGSTVLANSSPVTITGNLTLNSGTFDLNTRTVNVSGTVTIQAATLKMISASDKLTTFYMVWENGSNDNINNGEIDASFWTFNEGTNAALSAPNLAVITSSITPSDPDAEFGNLTLTPSDKGAGSSKTYYPVRVSGNCLFKAGANWFTNVDWIIAGNLTIEDLAGFDLSSGSDLYVNGNFTLAGDLSESTGSVATVQGDFIFPNTGVLNVVAGIFTNNYSVGSALLSGTLQLTTGTVEFPNRTVSIFSTFNDQISGGVFRVGKTLSANSAGTFQPLAGTVEFINASSGNYVQVTNGNYLYNMVLDKPGSSFQVYDNLIIKGSLFIDDGVLNSNNKTISIAENWYNNVGTSAFNETTGRVIFNGTSDQFCSTEDFYILEVNKPLGMLYNVPYHNITCQVYDWTSGGLWISPGNFSAVDLADDGLFGTFAIYNGTMDLHQDIDQYVDLNGSVFVGSGGTLNVYGGNGDSWWPFVGNATVTMNGGILDFKDVGINVNPSMTYTFTENITAGTIRTTGSFSANNAAFTPSGGSVELYGTLNTGIYNNYGSTFYNVLLNKTLASDGEPVNYIDREGKSVTLTLGDQLLMTGNVVVNGDLTVNSGKLYSGNTGNMLSCLGNVNVENTAALEFGAASQLKLNNTLSIKSGGTFMSSGSLGYEVLVTRVGAPYYTFSVESGGNISANNTIFEYMGVNGINVKSGALVDLSNAFNYCTFRNGGPGQTLLMVNNDQELSCTGAIFPANTWGGNSNVTKWVNQGRITFYDFSGGFSGPGFEQDLFGRVDWFTPTLSASPLTLNVNPPAGSTTFDITSNLAWTVSESTTWFSVNTASGSNNATITVTFDQNSSAVSRSGIITISAAGVPNVMVTVVQAGATLSVLPAIQNVTAAAGTTTFNVSSNTSWTVAESTAWFSVLPMSGSGNNTLTVTYTQNTSVSARSGQITVSSTGLPNVVVTVNQAGAGAILTVLPANRDVTPPAGTTTFSVTSNTGWAISESVPWLSVLPASGTGNGTLTVTYGENATGSSRTGNITVTATGGTPVVTVTVTQESYPTHNIMLTSGWTGLSSYIMPVNNDIADVFAPVDYAFVIAQTMSGVYYPSVPMNTIGDWLSQSAYKVKMSNQAVLPIIGNEELNKTFAMSTGWSLVPVICNTPVNVATLFPGATLKILKDVAGLGIYWPEFGINTLGAMLPGSAYYAYMNSPGSVIFPANAKEAVPFEMPSRKFPENPWNNIEITASSHQIAILNQGMEGVLSGDILGVFDENGHCYGVSTLDLSTENSIITAYANDEFSTGKTGFLNGELMQLRLYRPQTNEMMDVIARFDLRLPQQQFFQNEGLSAISNLKVANVGVSENAGYNIRIFPNPATDEVSISGISGYSSIEIYASDGSLVKTIQIGNVEQKTFDIADLSKGVYQLRFSGSQSSVYKKLIKN